MDRFLIIGCVPVSKPLSLCWPAAAGPPEPEPARPEDLSDVPPEILEEMGNLPSDAADALLEAYKQRVALR